MSLLFCHSCACPHTTCYAPEAGRKGAPSSEKGKPAASPTPPAARGKSRRVGPTSTSLVATASITLSPSTRGEPNTAAQFQQAVAEEVGEVLLVANASAMPRSPSTRGSKSGAQMQGGYHVLTNMMQKGSVRTILTVRSDVPEQVHTRAYVPTLMVITRMLTNARQAITHCMRQVVCYP